MTEQKPQWSALEAYRCANTVIRIHGDGPLAHASGRIQALLLQNDEAGAAAWGDIYRAIKVLTHKPTLADGADTLALLIHNAKVRERAAALVREHGTEAAVVVAAEFRAAMDGGVATLGKLSELQTAGSDLLWAQPEATCH